MEVANQENYLGEGVIEAYSQKSNEIDEQEDHYASASASKLQFRKVTLKARWSDETGMAEVVDKKGTIWRTTGIVRSSKLYFSIEEVLFKRNKFRLRILMPASIDQHIYQDVGHLNKCSETNVELHIYQLGE